MAVTIDSYTNSKNVVFGSSISFNGLTVGNGQNRALIVFIWLQSTSVSVSSVTWGNLVKQPCQFIQSVNDGQTTIEIWGLLNPASGNNPVIVNFSGSVNSVINAASFSGVNQSSFSTAFFDAANNGGTTNRYASVTIPQLDVSNVSTQDLVVGMYLSRVGFVSISGSLFFDDNPGPEVAASWSPGASSVTMQADQGFSFQCGAVGVAIKSDGMQWLAVGSQSSLGARPALAINTIPLSLAIGSTLKVFGKPNPLFSLPLKDKISVATSKVAPFSGIDLTKVARPSANLSLQLQSKATYGVGLSLVAMPARSATLVRGSSAMRASLGLFGFSDVYTIVNFAFPYKQPISGSIKPVTRLTMSGPGALGLFAKSLAFTLATPSTSGKVGIVGASKVTMKVTVPVSAFYVFSARMFSGSKLSAIPPKPYNLLFSSTALNTTMHIAGKYGYSGRSGIYITVPWELVKLVPIN